MSLSRIATGAVSARGTLTYHCACRLRLAESCALPPPCGWVCSSACSSMLFCLLLAMLFFSFLSKRCAWLLAVASELLSSPHSVCVGSLVLCPQSFSLSTLAGCGRDAAVLESICLFSRARRWHRNPAGTTHVVRPCFQGLRADVCTLSLASCSVAPPCRRSRLVHDANLPSALSRRMCTSATSDSCSRRCIC